MAATLAKLGKDQDVLISLEEHNYEKKMEYYCLLAKTLGTTCACLHEAHVET